MRARFTLLALVVFAVAMVASAQNAPDINPNVHITHVKGWAKPGGAGSNNLNYHSGGATITSAHVVYIFWSPTFNDPTKASGAAQTTDNSNDYNYAQTLQAFRTQFGGDPEYNTITQYYNNIGGTTNYIQLASLGAGSADWFDTSVPPNNVTDAIVQCEVKEYLATAGSDPGCGLGAKGQGHATDYSAVYEVVLPASNGSGAVYSSSGTSDSCGGPNLQYCAYHSHYNDAVGAVKYSIEPYPSCSGCWVSGWTDTQNQEHFVCHETREAVTDALGNAWYDRQGYEADDKCAWTPTPFIGSGGYGYQYEWSNANSGCIQTR
ncbi:MAG: hypothetical protein NVSMB68_03360 [Thermoanaerobaculia bacterium]